MGLACPPFLHLFQNLHDATEYYASGTSEILQSETTFFNYLNNYKIAQWLFSIFFSPCIHISIVATVALYSNMYPLNHNSTVLIIGGGTWGSPTALQLARRGYSRIKVLDASRFPSPIAAGNDINKIAEGTYRHLNIV